MCYLMSTGNAKTLTFFRCITYRTSEVDSDITTWERDTWPELEKLARLYPEAGIHFQGAIIFLPNYF